MTSLRRSIAFSGARVYLSTLIGLASTMVIARLLRPEEVGVFAVAAGLLGLVSVFRDFGVASYIIREPALDKAKLDTCFSVTLCLSWTLAAVITVSAPFVARFYAEPGLRDVMLIQAAGLIVIPFNSTQLALLKRERRFDRLLYIDVTSATVYAVTAIALALAGASYMALAWASFATLVATVALTQAFSTTDWRMAARFSEWRAVAGFGGYATAISIANTLINALPELIVGKALGLHHAGVLSRAFGLLRPVRSLVVGAVDPVLYADAAHKHREGVGLAADYVRAVSYLGVIALPFFAFVMLLALPLVRVLFGGHWDDSADILRILAVSGLCLPFFAFNQSYFVSTGGIRTHLMLLLAIAPFKITAWLLALPFGLAVAAQAYVLAHLVHTGISLALVCRRLRVGLSALAGAALLSLLVALATLTPPVLLVASAANQGWSSLASLVVASILAALAWLAAIFTFKHPFREEVLTGVRMLTPLFRRPKSPR